MPAQKGERHHRAKLTEDDVRKIRELRKDGYSALRICEEIGWKVGLSSIESVFYGKTWRHVK